jgi:triosephosphate isomerase
VIAYEPVWAIGTGLPETPQNANMQANFIKKEVGDGIRVLYGGSVNAKNIDSYLAMPFINGALVGGASLNAKEFKRILEIAERL